MSRMMLKLYDYAEKLHEAEDEIKRAIEEAIDQRKDTLEISSGKDNLNLRRFIIKCLEKPNIKNLFHRLHKDSRGSGNITLYFRHKNPKAYH